MGVYDFVLFEKGVELDGFSQEKPSYKYSWQTREFRDPMFRLHVVTETGELYRANHEYTGGGITETDCETDPYDFLSAVRNDPEYTGQPRDYSRFDWHRVRYVGPLRTTLQADTDSLVMYDICFDRHEINTISRVTQEDEDEITEGEVVFDKDQTAYKVVRVTETPANKYVAVEERKERGHVIDEAQTVADRNPYYPRDDRVVIIEPVDGGRQIEVPESRVTTQMEDSFTGI